jgi:hypothetical protein
MGVKKKMFEKTGKSGLLDLDKAKGFIKHLCKRIKSIITITEDK